MFSPQQWKKEYSMTLRFCERDTTIIESDALSYEQESHPRGIHEKVIPHLVSRSDADDDSDFFPHLLCSSSHEEKKRGSIE
jgi:hypothetical protein